MENNTGIDGTDEMDTDSDDEGADIEQEMEAHEEVSADSETAPNDKVEAKKEATPAYATFLEGLKRQGQALGLNMKDQKGFFQFANAATGHKLYVAKQGKGVTRIDTTLPRELLGDISLPLEKENGRIACHVKAEEAAVSLALETLATYSEKIRAPKRQPKAQTAS